MKIQTLLLQEAWESSRRALDQFVRDVTSIVNRGVRIRDQWAAEVKEIRLGGEAAATSVAVTMNSAPITVMLLSARRADLTGAVVSGGAIEWEWTSSPAGGGFITITDVPGVSLADDMVMTIAIVEG